MRIYDLIEKKKKRLALNKEEIAFFIDGIMSGKIKDYETTALLTAICLCGMTMEETFELTMQMAHSGDVMNYNTVKGIVVDKHSTGGVSDTTTLIVVPILASIGLKVAKMSGGSLGFTGGTADKLKVFSGYNLNLSEEEFLNTINRVGASIIAPNKNLAPADKILYELRHLTANVESIPLIASSIMSKKLASNADIIVLDVKFGSGAFMKTLKDATLLAKTMVEIGKRANKKVSAILTSMDEPLGSSIGNQLEVKNAIEVLNGKRNNLGLVSKRLVEEILFLSGYDVKQIKKAIDDAILSGNALLKLQEMVRAHGGDDLLISRMELMKKPKYKQEILSNQEGFVSSIQTAELGKIVALLGGAKQEKNGTVDNTVGIELFVHLGSKVSKGEKIATIYYNKKEEIEEIVKQFEKTIIIEKQKRNKQKLIRLVIR